MSQLSREELERTATHFDIGHNEYIQCRSVSSAVQSFMDRYVYEARRNGVIKEVLSVEVDCYVMHEWTSRRLSYWADDLVEFLIDKFHDDEDLCGEDGLDISESETDELKKHALEMVTKFSEQATPQTLRHIGTIHLSMDEATKIVESMNQATL